MPLRSDELAALGLGQFPVVIGAVVVAVNVEGVRAGEIRFTGPVLAEIWKAEPVHCRDMRYQPLDVL